MMPVIPINLIWQENWGFLLSISGCHCAPSLFLSLQWNIACVCSSVWKGMWAWGNPDTATHRQPESPSISDPAHFTTPLNFNPTYITRSSGPSLMIWRSEFISQNCSTVQSIYLYLTKIQSTPVRSGGFQSNTPMTRDNLMEDIQAPPHLSRYKHVFVNTFYLNLLSAIPKGISYFYVHSQWTIILVMLLTSSLLSSDGPFSSLAWSSLGSNR